MLLMAGLGSRLDAQQTIGAPRGADNRTDLVGNQLYTVGQTFTVGSEYTVLDNFSFWLAPVGSYPAPNLFAYVMAWDDAGRHATGPTLYKSLAPAVATDASPTKFTFNIRDGISHNNDVDGFFDALSLNPNSMYIAFLSDVEQPTGVQDIGAIGVEPNAPYAGGAPFYTTTGSSQWRTTQWTQFPPEWDLSFEANLSAPVTATPEPASLTLMVTGLGGIAGFARRRRARLSNTVDA